MRDYWVPRHKYQLVDALGRIYPDGKAKLRRMPMKQLLAIWHKEWAKSRQVPSPSTAPA